MPTLREEFEEMLDTLESWTDGDEIILELIAAYPNKQERSLVAERLYNLAMAGSPLGDLALAVWGNVNET